MSARILIVGTGAIGGFYGALLAKAGAHVAVVCRSDFDYIQAHGITVDSVQFGTWTFRPAQVLRDIRDYEQEADYLILCTKVLEGLDRAELMRGGLSAGTTLVLLQNGIDIEEEIARAFPRHTLVSALAFICANRTGPGRVIHTAYGRLAMGKFPGGIDHRVDTLCQLFEAAGIECEAAADIIATRWRKCVWNAPFNPLSVLSGGLDTLSILTRQEPLVRAIMAEVCTVAEALDHPLPAGTVDTNIANTRAMPPYKTSMLLDFEAGRPMETEAILGNAVRAARSAGAPAPRLETLYGLMKLREAGR